jgi:8-oxo-dGTP pyrophosphatase MutT (NUDIX family)
MTDPALERPGWLDTLTDSLSEQSRLNQVVALRSGIGARPAAVLILIGEGPEGPEIMFVERAAGLRNHAGQIAFPGGAAEVDDHDLADTALREAAEETGVDRSGIEVLGVLPPAYVEVSGFDVTAVIAWWREPSPVAVIDSREAASIDIVPVAVLTDPAHRARVRHPSGYTGPAFEVNGHLLWGLTAHLLDGVLDLAGWQRPWDRRRVVPIPARYLTDSTPDRGGPDAH